ncbi:hypothetical protein THAOC_04104 [Thalassiosira oceanica]|uniref:Uncharacterized protein n=1 Tax=Thalassiosira oceanica TaxID=159749 RepID=K0TJZ1_THAOC|nr:hypothetical protein THAOC_04104 [Thalassiosira oceanica]|eukprot:EJK74226.1 hypothetical protein THAOC_04104 [Thalassiosira oceanica]
MPSPKMGVRKIGQWNSIEKGLAYTGPLPIFPNFRKSCRQRLAATESQAFFAQPAKGTNPLAPSIVAGRVQPLAECFEKDVQSFFMETGDRHRNCWSKLAQVGYQDLQQHCKEAEPANGSSRSDIKSSDHTRAHNMTSQEDALARDDDVFPFLDKLAGSGHGSRKALMKAPNLMDGALWGFPGGVPGHYS